MPDLNDFQPQNLIPYLTKETKNPRQHTGISRKLKPAAVLVPILKIADEWSLLYTRRSEQLQKHRGQVAFPGGSMDDCDAGFIETALREAWEEIALPEKHVEILGCMHIFDVNSGFQVTPVVGWIKHGFTAVPSPDEVARVFTVPLSWFLDPSHLQLKTMETPWERRENVVFYEPYDGELVWGFTGWITMEFIKLIEAL